MATRSGRLSKPDKQGKYVRQLGWKINSSGKRVQHKFRLGGNKREAERRDDKLRQIWEAIENEVIQKSDTRNQRSAMVLGGELDATVDAADPRLAVEPLWDEDVSLRVRRVLPHFW